MSTNRFLACVLMAVALLTLNLGCEEGQKESGETIKIGVLLPFQGPLAEAVKPIEMTIRLAVDDINKAGGAAGKEIELVVADTQTDPTIAGEEAKKMIADGIEFIYGAASSGATLAVMAETIPSGVVLINSMSISPAITANDNQGLVYRSFPGMDRLESHIALKIKEKGYGKMTIISSESMGPSSEAALLGGSFAALECSQSACEMTQHAYAADLDFDNYDFSPLVTTALADNPDVLAVIGYTPDSLAVLNAVAASNYAGPIIVNEAVSEADIRSFLSSDMISRIRWASYVLPTGAAVDKFCTDYDSATGKDCPATNRSFAAYDIFMILALAIEKAQTTDPAVVKDAIPAVANAPGDTLVPADYTDAITKLKNGEDVDYQGLFNLDFDDNGDVSDVEVQVYGWGTSGIEVAAIP